MPLDEKTQQFLKDLGLDHVETIADRRNTLALKVVRDGVHMVLKLAVTDGSKESEHKAQLLLHEADVLSQIPDLTNNLYVDHGESNGRHWLLIREIEGDEVHQATKQIRDLSVPQDEKTSRLLDVMLKVSSFYDKLYAGGYLHGDVQPAHTYLEDSEITVIDWGLSKKVGESNPSYKGGFIYYVAPEIATRMLLKEVGIDYTPRSEVYALGATLYLFFTGSIALDFGVEKSEFKNVPIEEKLGRVVENRIFSFEEVGAYGHSALEAFLKKALATDPEDRFANPSEMYQEFSALVNV